jgi:ribosomal protein S18 acetylase RimI-like enzyme
VEIRAISDDDDLDAITDLVHAAYLPHAQSGLRYWGTHQTVDDTAKRIRSGTALLMLDESQYVGIVIVRPPQPESAVPLYRQPDVWSISQFCVSPEIKGKGYGRELHEKALSFASDAGAEFMALDTAEPAKGLIAMYQSWDYSLVGRCDWRPHTNYESVLMKRAISNRDRIGP